jgi:hypothetical protein
MVDDRIIRDYIAVSFSCTICGLELKNTAEIRAAGIEQQYVRTESESMEQRFMSNYADDEEDYGND